MVLMEFFKNATVAVSLKYLRNLWRSLEMPLINCKVKLKPRSIKHFVLSLAFTNNDNGNNDDNNITFNIKNTKLYVAAVTLSAKDNKKLSKLFSKEFERSVYWNEYKTKSENKNTTNEYRYVLKSKLC